MSVGYQINNQTMNPVTITNRGFTMHEHMDQFKLINMNGRVYDPVLGQFLSPDPLVGNASSTMDYNRYAYCNYNPLKYTDPSGYIFKRQDYEPIDPPLIIDIHWQFLPHTGASGSTNFYATHTYIDGNEGGMWVPIDNITNIYYDGVWNIKGINELMDAAPDLDHNTLLASISEGEMQSGDGIHGIANEMAFLLLRIQSHLADAVSIYGNFDIFLGVGSDFSICGRLYMKSGPDAGLCRDLNSDMGFGLGYDIGASVLYTEYYYTGSVDNLHLGDFAGARFSASIGLSYYIEGGYGVSVARHDDGGLIIGISKHLGVSPPGPSFNINFGATDL